jgi:DNA (cytosine-5)-methyltransferase 1
MLRLQGFPDSYKITGSYQAMRKLAGNSVAIPCVQSVIKSVLESLLLVSSAILDSKPPKSNGQLSLLMDSYPAQYQVRHK